MRAHGQREARCEEATDEDAAHHASHTAQPSNGYCAVPGIWRPPRRLHLKEALGAKRLDEIGVGEIAQLRAQLVANPNLGEKYINNILAVLSKALRYAADCEVIAKAPKVGLFKVERPEIVAWDFAQYARLLAAAKAESPEWYAAVCLAGEAGLRVGEVKALRWREEAGWISARRLTSGPPRRGEASERGDALAR